MRNSKRFLSHEVSMIERMNNNMIWIHSRQDKYRDGNNGKSHGLRQI